MKIVSYNVNGIRASLKLGLAKWLRDFEADIYCIQEIRCNENLAKEIINQNDENLLNNYISIFNCGKIPGYAGTLILTKQKPDKVLYDMGDIWTDDEGRTTTIFLGNLAIINAYIPNGNNRLEFKMKYLSALNKFIVSLKKSYDVVCVGDFNIAHNEIDISNPKACKNKSVFLPVERQSFDDLLSIGMNDCFRILNPNTIKYSWRSYRSRQDENYNSWKYRIDYILVGDSLIERIHCCDILDLTYSDHSPVLSEIKEEI